MSDGRGASKRPLPDLLEARESAQPPAAAPTPRNVCLFVRQAGQKLYFGAPQIATALCVVHAFRGCKNVDADVDWALLGTTALFLAAKMDTAPVDLRDVVNTAYRTLHPNDSPLKIGEEYKQLRESVVTCELIVLRTLGFSLNFDLPHQYVLHFVSALSGCCKALDASKDGQSNLQRLAQLSWTLLNDFFMDPLCLACAATPLAVTVIHLACSLLRFDLPSTALPWWQHFWPDGTSQKLNSLSDTILQSIAGVLTDTD
eukprot:m.467518 g.467518  ORF g.467518 m.467518 type:complete len:258 (+) comp20364_c1_seq1:1172-1945(+)